MFMKDELNDQQELFIENYLIHWNATEAAKLAGYSGDRKTLSKTGSRLRNHPRIAERIKERIEEVAMTADEVLIRLTQQARGEAYEFIRADAEGGHHFDIEALQRAGWGHLIKSISFTKTGETIRAYDAQAALLHLGKLLRLFSNDGERNGTLKVVVEYADGEFEDSVAEAARGAEADSSGGETI
jgi:hypothetical protein